MRIIWLLYCLLLWPLTPYALPHLAPSASELAAGPVRLDARWALDFAELHTDFAHAVNETQAVPGLWHQDKQHPNTGFATLRLQLHMPTAGPWYLYVPDMPSAMALYVNGELLYQRGQVASNAAAEIPRYGPAVVNLPPATDYQLLLQISNYHHKDAGIWHSLRIADRAHLADLQNQNQLIDVLLFAVLASLGIYHLGLWYLRRQEKVALYFGLFSLSVALRSLIVGERVAYLWPLPLNWENLQRLEHILLYLAIPFFARYFAYLYPRYVHRALLPLTTAGCALLVLLTLLTPATFFTHLGAVAQVWILLLSLYVVSVGLRAWQHNAHFSRLFLSSFALLFITVLNDFLYTHLILQTRPLVQLGVIAFVIMQAALLNRRYVHSLNAVEHMHENLKEKNRALKQLHDFKDILLANTSHELRTPVHGMLGLTEQLLKTTADNTQQTLIERIRQSAQHINQVIGDLLDSDNMPELQRRQIPLAPLLQQARALLTPLLENGVSLHLHMDDQLEVYADASRLQQVLINLLGNAIKFTQQGQIHIHAHAAGEQVLIEVQDNGPGIPPDDWPRLLQRYQQGEPKGIKQGQGLGLAISQDILQKHASRLQLLPSEKGSRIGFYLARSARVQEKIPFNHQPCGNCEGNKLVVIDDDCNNLELVRQQLAPYYHLRLCDDLQQGLQIIQQWRPDCVLLDVMLPAQSGIDALCRIRQQYSQQQLPVLMFTASHQKQHLIAALRQGANDYLNKPYAAEELQARIENQLSQKRLWQQSLNIQQLQLEQNKQQALHQQTEQHNSQLINLLNLLPTPVLLFSQKGVLQFANPACLQHWPRGLLCGSDTLADVIGSSHAHALRHKGAHSISLSAELELTAHALPGEGWALLSSRDQQQERLNRLEDSLGQLLHSLRQTEHHPQAEQSDESLRELGVKLARQCLNLWERYTGKSKAELAESSKIWRVYIDGSTVKTRTLDKYLALSSLPKQPRWRSVLRTAAFVQEHCQLNAQDAQALQQLAASVDARLSLETE